VLLNFKEEKEMKKFVLIVTMIMTLLLSSNISVIIAAENTTTDVDVEEYSYADMLDDQENPIPENIDELLTNLKKITPNTPVVDVVNLVKEIDPLLFDKDGYTPFFDICRYGSVEHLQAIYDYTMDKYAINPVTYSYDKYDVINKKLNPLMASFLSQKSENVKFVLTHGGAIFSKIKINDDLDYPICIYTSLLMKNFDADVLRIMVSNGADINSISTITGRTPLINVISNYGKPETEHLLYPYDLFTICRYMIEELRADIFLKSKDGYSPVQVATIFNQYKLASYMRNN